MVRRFVLLVLSICFLILCGCKLSGSITYNAQGLEGIVVELSGDATLSTSTDSQGKYSFEVEPGTYTVTPHAAGFDFTPPYRVVVMADEDLSGVDFEAHTNNRPPTLDPIGNQTIYEGQLLEFEVTAQDPDGDGLIFSAMPLPAGATFVEQVGYAVFRWTPGSGMAGSYEIVFTVSDDNIASLSDSATITIEVFSDDSSPFPSVDDFAASGPFATRNNPQGGPNEAYSLYYPVDMGLGGLKHPIITWGNGTGATPIAYSGLLKHWASHGFVVIASNSTQTGSGEEMVQGVAWLISENSRPGSLFFNRIDTDAVGASGHSQGGGGAINAGNDPRVTCTAPIQPAPGNVGGLQGPMFVIAGSDDTIVSPQLVSLTVYGPATVPSVFGILAGADHFAPVGSAEGMRGYLTAWFRLHLMKDESARNLFYGENCSICNDSNWTVQRKYIE